MEKTIKIDGKEIVLKSGAMNLLIYRDQFGADMLKPQWQFVNEFQTGNPDVSKIDGIEILKIAWTMAKTKDRTIEPFEEWIESFDEFPIVELIGDLSELIVSNLTSISKIKNAKTTTKKN